MPSERVETVAGSVADAPSTKQPVSAVRTAEPKAVSQAQMESTTIRVAVNKVDQLINLVGELVITQAMLAQNSRGLDAGAYQQLLAGLADLDRNTRDLQESVMSIRMIPMSIVFSRFPRMLRDLANKLGKKVEMVTLGEATEPGQELGRKNHRPVDALGPQQLRPWHRNASGPAGCRQVRTWNDHFVGIPSRGVYRDRGAR